jgi:hypothetical protein
MKKAKSIEEIFDINENDMYIDTEFSRSSSNPELNLSNISWTSLVDDELYDSMEERSLSKNLSDTTPYVNTLPDLPENTEAILTMDDISNCDFTRDSDVTILKYQTIIAKKLRNYIKNVIDGNEQFDLDEYINKLNLLCNMTKYLSNKIGLILHKHELNKLNSIPRSSYKFCNYGYNCEFNYNHVKFNGCYEQHYVHNLVYADATALIYYVSNNDKINYNEIMKCINTLVFVLNHMYDELKQVEYFNKDTVDKLHKDRKLSNKNNKNNSKKIKFNKKKKKNVVVARK